MKVEICNYIDGYSTRSYDLNDEILEDYIEWCEENEYNFEDENNLLEYLDCCENCEEDIDIDHTEIISHEGFSEVLSKCVEIAYEYKRCKTKISGDNSETE